MSYELTQSEREEAIAMTAAHWLIRLARIDTLRIGMVAAVVWPHAARMMDQANRTLSDPLSAGDRDALISGCRAAVEYSPNYAAISVGFWPIVFGVLLQLIVKLLLEYWLTKQAAAVVKEK